MKTQHLMAATALAGLGLYREKKDEGGGPDPVLEAVAAIKQQIVTSHDKMTEDLGKLKTDFGSNTKEHEKFKAEVDEKLTKNAENFASLKTMLDDLAQKAARSGDPKQPKQKSLGQQIVADEGFKKFTGAKGESVRLKVTGDISLKAVTGLDASAGHLVEPTNAGIVVPAQRRMTIRGLIAQGRTNSDSVKFVREAFTNNAAPQAGQGAAKAESDLTYTPDTAEVVTIAHFIRASRQILSDAPALEAQIDTRLRVGLNYREELQLLLGSGATNNIEGLVTGATAFARPSGFPQTAGATHIDVLRVAALQATVAEYFVDGFVLNPVDWALIETVKDTTGRYIVGDPNGNGFAALWGTPVAPTNAMPATNFLAGAFGMAAQIFDREDTDVLMSGEDIDNFTKNMVTILAEKRLTQVIYNALALVTGTFATAKTALAA